MDYHAIHGQDNSSFDLSSINLVPSATALQILEDLERDGPKCVSTGLEALDGLLVKPSRGLGPSQGTGTGDGNRHGGVQQGQITEVWGPPGVGKTAFGIQLAAEALRDGRGVVWVGPFDPCCILLTAHIAMASMLTRRDADGFHTVCTQRLARVVEMRTREDGPSAEEQLANFTHYNCPSLPHFLALMCGPATLSFPETTSLVVVDCLSALINHAFPRIPEPKGSAKSGRYTPQSARRPRVLQNIISALQKLAASRNLVVVVLTQCATKMQAKRGATLIPAINARLWEEGISTRLVLFRDWIWEEDKPCGVSFAAVQRFNGRECSFSMERLAAFKVDGAGFVAVNYDANQRSIILPSAPALKRKLADTDIEIPDSDEEYGWQDEDVEDLPRMPPQWQGSEDLLLGENSDSEAGGVERSGEEPDSHSEAEHPNADD